MLSNGRLNVRRYLQTASLLAAGTGALVGLCGVIATLAPTLGIAVLGAAVFFFVGLIVGGLIGGLGWIIRAPIALSQIGAAYSVVVGLLLTTIVEGAFTGGENTSPVSWSSSILSVLAMGGVSVLIGSIPNLLWLIYSRLRSTDNREHL
jgi:hypothetical protein